jgi:hypothetical protein
MRLLLIAAVLVWCTWGCGSSPTAPTPSPSPSPAPSPSPPTAPAAATSFRVTGVVADEMGTPLSGLPLHFEFAAGDFASVPELPCNSYCTISTDAAGRYELGFKALPNSFYGSRLAAGLVHTWRQGYQSTVLLLPLGTTEIVQNIRLRRSRVVRPGESVSILIDSDSSLCTDLEDWFVMDRRCEQVEIVTDTAGYLTVDARESVAGRPVPLVFFRTTGNYTTFQNRGSGVVSVGVSARERYIVMIGVPLDLAPQRYELTTTIQP